ncbi:hypothetical protein HRbin30_02072 [bacterium HR30]|nr:hypothetical protein HRbin30_02072 [bacterium HR30]
MGFEIGGLVGKKGVCGRVGFVETVRTKSFHLFEYGLCQFLRHPALNRTAHEASFFALHLVLFLFAHGAAQVVGIAEGVSRQHAGNLHHLFLVQNDAVGFF